MNPAELTDFIAEYPPFDALSRTDVAAMADSARQAPYAVGAVVIDGFDQPADGLFIVLEGRVGLWNSSDAIGHDAQELVGPGGVFGFSALLTGRPIGPRAVALAPSTVAFIPADEVRAAFSTTSGARFLAEHLALSQGGPLHDSSYQIVDDLIVRRPILAAPDDPVSEIARSMTERDVDYAAVQIPDGTWGIVTDRLIRERLVVDALPLNSPASAIMQHPAPVTRSGESAAGAMIHLLDQNADFLLVLDRQDTVVGAVSPADFAVSGSSGDVALRQQLAQAPTPEDLIRRSRNVPGMVEDLLGRGLATSKVTAVFSSTVDAIVRRALVLTFARHPDLDIDEFTWLVLGSTARNEAVLSSDLDTAVAFRHELPEPLAESYRQAFGEVNTLLGKAGVHTDEHGATAARAAFARSTKGWKKASRQWMADPVAGKGAIMTSLMVDARPIHGDPGLPTVSKVFTDLRQQPATMRLLLTESLSARARLRSMKDVLAGRAGTFDIKAHALVPVVNVARWAALVAGSHALSTTERLRDAAGGVMLPESNAQNLIDVFEVLQRVRLRYQLHQLDRGVRPTDVVMMSRLSAIDRGTISKAVREVAANQRRMSAIAARVNSAEWFDASPS